MYSIFLEAAVEAFERRWRTKFSISLFLGWVGLLNVICLSPLFVVFHFSGFERFQWPPWRTLLYILLNAFIGTFISDYCWA